MSLSTVLAALLVTLVISSLAAAAGYFLQARLRRLEELETRYRIPETMSLPESAAPTAGLVVTQGPGVGQRYPLAGQITRLGRRPDLCDIVFDDPSVSGLHCSVVVMGEREYGLKDEGSTNGTFLNRERVGSEIFRLSDGDRIQIGTVILEFHQIQATAAAGETQLLATDESEAQL